MSVVEAADCCRMHPKAILYHVRGGNLRADMFGGSYMLQREDVEEFRNRRGGTRLAEIQRLRERGAFRASHPARYRQRRHQRISRVRRREFSVRLERRQQNCGRLANQKYEQRH